MKYTAFSQVSTLRKIETFVSALILSVPGQRLSDFFCPGFHLILQCPFRISIYGYFNVLKTGLFFI